MSPTTKSALSLLTSMFFTPVFFFIAPITAGHHAVCLLFSLTHYSVLWAQEVYPQCLEQYLKQHSESQQMKFVEWMNRLIKSVLLVIRRNILRSHTAVHWMAGCCHSRAYLACQAAEIPVKSAQESVQARVAPVDTPKLNSSPAEGFLLSCVLEREMLRIATGQLDFEHRRERFPFDFFFPGGQVEKVSLLTCGPAIQVFCHVNGGCSSQ